MVKEHSVVSERKPAATTWFPFFWLAARVLLYAPSHRQDSTYHGLCYTKSWSTGWKEKYSVVEYLLMIWRVVWLISYGGPIELLLVPASAPGCGMCYPEPEAHLVGGAGFLSRSVVRYHMFDII